MLNHTAEFPRIPAHSRCHLGGHDWILAHIGAARAAPLMPPSAHALSTGRSAYIRRSGVALVSVSQRPASAAQYITENIHCLIIL